MRREGIASYSLSIFEDSSNCEVNATCVTKDLGIIGLHAKGPSRTAGRQAQLAILPLASEGVKPKCYDPMRDPHLVSKSVNNERKGGITALAGVDYDNSLKFLSSGSDKHTYLWTIYPHTHRYTASTERLSFQTRAIVQALGFERGSGTVLSADGKRILSLDLSSNAVRKNVTMAHNVYNIHTGQSPYVVLLETESVDAQIQMYDLRSGNFDRPPVVAFGQDLPSYVPEKLKFLSPSARGSLSPNKQLFARGFNDGGVQVWDLRKHTVATKTYDHRLHSGSIFHTAFISESELVARENNALWFIDTKRA
ncbi:hypothetical protein BV25DRAFT_1917869 [Artomyces pyxidatus]|uniref:Uncharacterized protein n=1 Tax=Artomyces pyxidatus TaxID=48021 RepID=A0ACB8SWK9_9AGAM|nr:hypothetical protein BV25DRAFT_1917869 [Artomyces pyxidatus]